MALFDFLGSQQTGTQTVTQSIDPQIKQAYLDNVSFANTVASRPYEQYSGPRIASFTGDQNQAFQQARDLQNQYQPYINQAGATLQAGMNFNPAMVGYNAPNPQGYSAVNAGFSPLGGAQGYNAVNAGFNPLGAAQNFSATTAGFNPLGAAQTFGVANSNFNPLSEAATYGGASVNRGNIRDIGAGSFLSGNVGAYMNPYTTEVIDVAMRDNERARQLAQQQVNAQAASRGAYGGSRQAIAESENRRNFLDTQARTSAQLRNQGFDTAANLMQTDLGRSMQAQQANQGIDASVASQNAQFSQQAGLGNQAARNQFALQNFTSGLQNSQFNAANQNAANQANAQAQNQFALQNFTSGLQNNQFNAANQTAASQANAQAQNQFALQNFQTGNQTNQFNAANQTAANQFGAQNANQFALQNFLTGNQTNQFNAANQTAANAFGASAANQFGLQNAANNLAAQQFNSQQGLAGAQNRMQAANQFANLGSLSQQLGMNATNFLGGFGAQQQAQTQRNYDLANQDFQNQFNYPLQQLAIRQSALGTSIPNLGGTTSQPTFSNPLGNLLGAGLGIKELFNL